MTNLTNGFWLCLNAKTKESTNSHTPTNKYIVRDILHCTHNKFSRICNHSCSIHQLKPISNSSSNSWRKHAKVAKVFVLYAWDWAIFHSTSNHTSSTYFSSISLCQPSTNSDLHKHQCSSTIPSSLNSKNNNYKNTKHKYSLFALCPRV